MRTRITRAAETSVTLSMHVLANSRSASAKAVQTRSLIQEDDETCLMISRQEKTLATSFTSKARVSPWCRWCFLQERPMISFRASSPSQAFTDVSLNFSPPSKALYIYSGFLGAVPWQLRSLFFRNYLPQVHRFRKNVIIVAVHLNWTNIVPFHWTSTSSLWPIFKIFSATFSVFF